MEVPWSLRDASGGLRSLRGVIGGSWGLMGRFRRFHGSFTGSRRVSGGYIGFKGFQRLSGTLQVVWGFKSFQRVLRGFREVSGDLGGVSVEFRSIRCSERRFRSQQIP